MELITLLFLVIYPILTISLILIYLKHIKKYNLEKKHIYKKRFYPKLKEQVINTSFFIINAIIFVIIHFLVNKFFIYILDFTYNNHSIIFTYDYTIMTAIAPLDIIIIVLINIIAYKFFENLYYTVDATFKFNLVNRHKRKKTVLQLSIQN